MAKVLLVDDEPDERFLLRRAFERAGHEVRDASDGAEALRVVREFGPDLVVTDLMMPVMDGAELIRRLRAEPVTAAVLVLVSSFHSELAEGADATVHKTGQFRDVLEAAETLLDCGGRPC